MTERGSVSRRANVNATLFLAKFTFDIIRNNSNVTSGLQWRQNENYIWHDNSHSCRHSHLFQEFASKTERFATHPVYVSYTIFDGGELCVMKQSSLFSHIHLETIQRSMTGQSTLHVKTAFYKLIVSVMFTTGTFYETSDIFSLRQKRQL